MNDDDWELFVPKVGEVYPERYQYRWRGTAMWIKGTHEGLLVESPYNDLSEYRKPKQKTTTLTTTQQAMQDAIDSEAVEDSIPWTDYLCSGP